MTDQDYFIKHIESQQFNTIGDMLDFAEQQYNAYEQAAEQSTIDTEVDNAFVNWSITATYLFPYFLSYIRAVIALRKEIEQIQKEAENGTESV